MAVAAKELGEDGDLRLAHGATDVGAGVVHEIARGEPDGVEGGLEGLLDGSFVGHGGSGHVERGKTDGCGHLVSSFQVSSAMAGERVMPRPAGPVTITTPVSMEVR